MGLADLAGEAQVLVDAPAAVQVEVPRFAAGVRTVDVVDLARVAGEAGADQGVVADHRVLRNQAALLIELAGAASQLVFWCGAFELRIEAVQVDAEVARGLGFDVEGAALALLDLLEQRGADEGRHLHAGQRGIGDGGGAGRADRGIAEDLLAVAAHGLLLREALQQHAEGVLRVLPAHQGRHLRLGLAAQVVVVGLHRTFDGERLRKSSGRRVITLMAPETPPSTRSAVALFCTTTEPTSSDGSSEKLLERPTLPPTGSARTSRRC
jgi:hypothetical protein